MTPDVESTLMCLSRKRLLKPRVRTPDMVEHTVEHQVYPPLVAGGDESVEGGVIAKPCIDLEMVCGVIPVRLRGEYGTEHQSVRTEFDEVVEPGDDAIKTGCERPL